MLTRGSSRVLIPRGESKETRSSGRAGRDSDGWRGMYMYNVTQYAGEAYGWLASYQIQLDDADDDDDDVDYNV